MVCRNQWELKTAQNCDCSVQKKGTVSKISNQIIFTSRRRFLWSVLNGFVDEGCVENNSNGGHLRCLSGSVRAGESSDDAGLDRTLLIAARATSAELESRVYVLWLAQETSEKNTPNVLLRRLLREPQHINSQFKLSAGSPRHDEQGPIETCVIAGLTGAYRARKASQMPSIRVVFRWTKSQKTTELDVEHGPQKRFRRTFLAKT